MTRIVTCLAILLLCTACADSRDSDAGRDETAADTSTAPRTPGGELRIPDRESYHFDPGAVQVGDSVLGLKIREKDVHRVFDDSVWSGIVRFAGELELTGVYQPHFDYPEPAELCFQVTDSASVRRIPQFAPDAWSSAGMKRWFCFTNPEQARAALGPPEQPRKATVVVDDFTVVRQFTDAYSTARLVRVVNRGGPADRTLLTRG